MTEDQFSNRFLRLAKQFENLAETYREIRLHGSANDVEAWKGMSLMLAVSAHCTPRDVDEKHAA